MQEPSVNSVEIRRGRGGSRGPLRGGRGRGRSDCTLTSQYRPEGNLYRQRRGRGVGRASPEISTGQASGSDQFPQSKEFAANQQRRGHSSTRSVEGHYGHGNGRRAQSHRLTLGDFFVNTTSLKNIGSQNLSSQRGRSSHRNRSRGYSLASVESNLHEHNSGESRKVKRDLLLQSSDRSAQQHGRGGSTKHWRQGRSVQYSQGELAAQQPRKDSVDGRGWRSGSTQDYGRALHWGRGRIWRQCHSGHSRGGAVGNYDLDSYNKEEDDMTGSNSYSNKPRGRLHSRPQLHGNVGEIRYMSQEDNIERLARSDSQEVIRYIKEDERRFLAAFSHQPNCHNPLIFMQLIKLLYLLVKSDDDHLVARIVAEIFSDRATGTSVFSTCLDTFVRKMPMEARGLLHINTENPQYLSYLIEIGTFAISAVPLSVMYTFPYLSINDTVHKITQVSGDNVHLLVPKALSLVEDFTKAQKDSMPQPSPSSGINMSAPPPHHFTELSVFPTAEEIHPYAAKPYLRPNITKGGYTDWEHYLDVQFRLMREDFVASLRDGIRTFELKGAANSEIRIYEEVRVIHAEYLFSGIGFQLFFGLMEFEEVNWEYSKRLMFGSLVCLSCDNFQTIYFATVAKRDLEALTYGIVTIQFEGDQVEDIFLKIDSNERFVMVESTAYFEAYRHVLEGIKRASELHLTDRLQIFKKYLVDCQVTPPLPVPIDTCVSQINVFVSKRS